MALKAILTADEHGELPEAQRALYSENEDGGLVLDVDGVEAHPGARALKSALDAERASRRRANTKAEALAAELERYRGIDPDAAHAALARPEKSDGGGDGEAERRALEAARDAAAEDARSARRSLAREKLENRIVRAAAEAGVRRAAMADVLARGRELWQIDDDGTPVPIRDNAPVLAPDGEAWLAPEQWMAALSREAEHLFEPNRGGAAPGAQPEPAGEVAAVELGRPNAIGENLEAIAHGKVRVIGSPA